MRICITALLIAIFITQLGYAEVSKSPNISTQEVQALNNLSEQMSGYITWMSNRDGDWEIYRMDIDGNVISQLTDNDVPDMGALISPDGKLIAWHRGKEPKQDVWIMNADGSDQRMLIAGAVVGIWNSDRELVIHRGQNQNSSFLYDLETGKEKQIWPPKNAKLKAKDIHGATPSPDGKLFVAWAGNPRGTWIFSADGKFQSHVHGGCEGSFAPDGSFVYWVMTAGEFGRATLQGKVQDPLYKIGETHYGHTYFPRLSRDMKYLIFGACPNDQHDHDTSDYEIFLMKMDDLKPAWNMPIRLTYDPGTDRWADIFVRVDETPPVPPVYVEAEPHGQQVRLTWTDAQDSETEVIWYKVYRGTQENNVRLLAKVKDTVYVDRATNSETDYYYRVSAINAAGLEGGKSSAASAKTTDSKPMVPENLHVTRAGKGKARLTWASNPELDVMGYNIYRSLENGREYIALNSAPIAEPIYIDSSVEDGLTYYYRVSVIDRSLQESARSIPVIYTPEERVMPDGLLAFYPFDEGGGSVVHDRSGVEPPLDLGIRDVDKVLWLPDSSGVEFTRSSVITSNGDANKLFEKLRSNGALSVEVWFSPSNLSQSGPARIVSMSKDSLQRDFTIGQSGKELAIRLRTTKTSNNGIPELDTAKGVLSQGITHVVATYDGKVKKLYINGQQHPESQELSGDFSEWEDYPLLIGNELKDDRTWLGKIYLVAIYDRSLTAEEVSENYENGI